jgi:Uma2 family endonuclease
MTTLLMPTPDAEKIYSMPQFWPQLWRISVARYHEMIAAGMLTENDRLELLEGFMVEKMTVNPPHTYVTETLREALGKLVSESFFVNAQQPITMDDSEPEPDVVVISGNRRDYRAHHPGPEDVALVIEVSDSTLYQDQTWKKRIYARAGIPVYWIVNLNERHIEVYSQPSGPTSNPTYQQLITYSETDLAPVVLNDKENGRLPIHTLLP